MSTYHVTSVRTGGAEAPYPSQQRCPICSQGKAVKPGQERSCMAVAGPVCRVSGTEVGSLASALRAF